MKAFLFLLIMVSPDERKPLQSIAFPLVLLITSSRLFAPLYEEYFGINCASGQWKQPSVATGFPLTGFEKAFSKSYNGQTRDDDSTNQRKSTIDLKRFRFIWLPFQRKQEKAFIKPNLLVQSCSESQITVQDSPVFVRKPHPMRVPPFRRGRTAFFVSDTHDCTLRIFETISNPPFLSFCKEVVM